MANPLFNQFGNVNGINVEQLKSEAIKLRQSLPRNPKEIVEELVKTGQISQTALNQVFPFASQIGNSIK